MRELDAVLGAWRALDATGEEAVLATVVHVTGSAYRRPGARMLVLPHGQRVGMVSGGCLEGEITRKAWWYTESARPVVRVYDTSSGDDVVWEFGLGCNGVVHVMLERARSPEAAAMLAFLEARQRAGEAAVVATVVSTDGPCGAQVGDRLLVDAQAVCGGALQHLALCSEVEAHARHALSSAGSHLVNLAGTAVFIERVAPALDLVVFGAGDDVGPLVSAAAILGWRVTVADARPAYARAERFPGAASVVVLRQDDPLRGLPIGAGTSVVVMTHNYPLDTKLVPLILERQPTYVGLLGPRKRAERLFESLGRDVPPDVHAPAGLDLGGDDPAAVALSIVAEVQAVQGRRNGAMLRLRDGPIHAPVAEVGEPAPRQADVRERPVYCETLAGSHAA
jgi:xanthine/CO dehydrogenase XdhC/CoxF family maturation factor